jgi:hypothetical protein
MPEAAGVGSIGVISVMGEQTARDRKDGFRFEVITSGERKADGNPHIEITEGARKRVANRVDTCAGMFFDLVARSRRLKASKVEGYQADVFYGPEAVEKRLADGVSSWPDFLSLVTGQITGLDNQSSSGSRSLSEPTNRSDGSVGAKDKPMGLLALRKQRDQALAAFRKAKTIKANKSAAAAYSKACGELAKAEALTEARKMKKTRYVEETYKDDADDDSGDEDEGGGDDDDAEGGGGDDDAEGSAEGGSAEDEGGDDDAADGSAELEAENDADELEALAREPKSKALLSKLGKLTGQKTVGGIFGAVRGALENSRQVKAVAAELRGMKVEKMIKAGRESGRIEKGLVPFCTKMGMRSPDELAAYLKAKAPSVRTTEEDPIIPAEFQSAVQGAGLTQEQAEISRRMGFKPEEAAAIATKSNAKTNGAARR